MAWGSFVLGTQLTTIRLGVLDTPLATTGFRISTETAATIGQLLNSPYARGLLTLDSTQRLAASGSAADFPMLPRWRKTIRQIG